jgi:ribonuclease P protein component
LKSFKFLKIDRIRKRKEYLSLARCGYRYSNNIVVFNYRMNTIKRNRLGITVSKKVGNAVTRNRIKRIIRDYFRLHRDQLGMGIDLNVIVRSDSGKASAETLVEHLKLGFISIKRKYDDSRSDEKNSTFID